MKKFSVIVLVAASLLFAGFAEAAKPKKRTRNANRVGAYGALLIGQARFSGDQSAVEQDLIDFFENRSDPTRNISTSSKTEDIGFQATFGYRFNRYFATELGLVQFGELSSTVRGEVDQGQGFIPANVKYAFNVGGPLISVVGILPLGEKAEFYARLGYLFASSERELSARVDGQNGGANSAKGDSQEPVYGVGFAWHINQVYSIRAEYQKLDGIGQEDRTGTEDLDVIGLGFVVRF
ncbi:MAG: outer membrane beta-barrel protein [Pseudomonadota bacterium]